MNSHILCTTYPSEPPIIMTTIATAGVLYQSVTKERIESITLNLQ